LEIGRRTPESIQQTKGQDNKSTSTLPKREGKFQVETDVLEHAIKGVLSQEQEGKWKLIMFLSRTM